MVDNYLIDIYIHTVAREVIIMKYSYANLVRAKIRTERFPVHSADVEKVRALLAAEGGYIQSVQQTAVSADGKTFHTLTVYYNV